MNETPQNESKWEYQKDSNFVGLKSRRWMITEVYFPEGNKKIKLTTDVFDNVK